jgi:predicted ribosome quality control (RQC) complex YloA/Tae2 family protein
VDNLILESLLAEARPRLVGHPVWRVGEPSPDAIVLLFDDPDRSRLLIASSTAVPRLHLTRARPESRREPAPGAFAALCAHHLSGAILASIEKDPAERVVCLRFAGASGPGKSLVAEMLGRRSNAILLDPQDRVLGAQRRMKSEFRRPETGAPYAPPRRGDRIAPRALSAEKVGSLEERARRESHPLSDLLLEACPAIGALAAHEIERRAERGEEAFTVLQEWLDRAATPGGGFVYAETPTAAIDLRRAPAHGRFLLAPLPLASADPGLVRVEFPSLSEAADAYFGALAAGAAFRARREALVAIARKEARRAGEIAAKIARDLAEMEKADRYRVFGEALLAGMRRAVKSGATVQVPDPYDPEEKPLTLPIDPALSLQANAERYFQRHRKAERGRAVAEKRRGEQARRAQILGAVAARLDDAGASEDLDGGEAAMRAEGIAVGLERRPRARRGAGSPPAEPREAGVRLYTSSDGYEILVGKGGNENDRLTFKIASPEDFWLHAEGAAGAHVVVRNPKGEVRPPAATLREAAELAAFFSKNKNAGRTEVLVTRRKYVRRIRGAPRGTVTVKKHESILVAPKNPFEKDA